MGVCFLEKGSFFENGCLFFKNGSFVSKIGFFFQNGCLFVYSLKMGAFLKWEFVF